MEAVRRTHGDKGPWCPSGSMWSAGLSAPHPHGTQSSLNPRACLLRPSCSRLRPGSHSVRWGKPENILFSAVTLPFVSKGEPSPLPQEATCSTGGMRWGCPTVGQSCQGLRSGCSGADWAQGSFSAHPVCSLSSQQCKGSGRKCCVVSPRGTVQGPGVRPCCSSPSVLLLQAKKSAKKLQPQSMEPVRRPSQKEKRGRPEEKPRARSAPTWPILPELPGEPHLPTPVPRFSAFWGPLTPHGRGSLPNAAW